MNINKISSTATKMPLIARIAGSPAVKKTVIKLGKNIPMITVISVVSKDLVGALVLFYQTYHNKRIPEKKRKYLAAYELTSGSYNVAFPLTAGAILTNDTFKHKTAKMLFKDYYVDPKTMQKAAEDAKLATGAKKVALELAHSQLESKLKTFNKCNKGLAQFVAVIFTAIVSKRIICPFVGGPLATVFNKKVLQKQKDQ